MFLLWLKSTVIGGELGKRSERQEKSYQQNFVDMRYMDLFTEYCEARKLDNNGQGERWTRQVGQWTQERQTFNIKLSLTCTFIKLSKSKNYNLKNSLTLRVWLVSTSWIYSLVSQIFFYLFIFGFSTKLTKEESWVVNCFMYVLVCRHWCAHVEVSLSYHMVPSIERFLGNSECLRFYLMVS